MPQKFIYVAVLTTLGQGSPFIRFKILEVCSAHTSGTQPFWTDLGTGFRISWSLSDFLATRGLSVFETWGSKNIPGRIDFYIGSVSLEQIPTKVKKSGMSIIILSNVNDTVYPPQKKSFYMFRIIHERNSYHDLKWSRFKVISRSFRGLFEVISGS